MAKINRVIVREIAKRTGISAQLVEQVLVSLDRISQDTEVDVNDLLFEGGPVVAQYIRATQEGR